MDRLIANFHFDELSNLIDCNETLLKYSLLLVISTFRKDTGLNNFTFNKPVKLIKHSRLYP